MFRYVLYWRWILTKVKTSIYVEKDLWEEFKKLAQRKGVEPSKLLEELIREELFEKMLDEFMQELDIGNDYEIDFEPIKPRKDLVSDLIRSMRDERRNGLPR